MTVSHRYTDFGSAPKRAAPQNAQLNAEDLEEQKLQSFENGYQSGWDDATKAQTDAREHLTEEFMQNLQQAQFSYHEARARLSKDLQKVVEPLIDQLMPAIADETLPGHVVEIVMRAAQDALDSPLEIAVSPARMVPLRKFLDAANLPNPCTISPDEALDENQVFFRISMQEKEVNLTPWITEARATLHAQLNPETEGSSNE